MALVAGIQRVSCAVSSTSAVTPGAFSCPATSTQSDIKATFENGVLTIDLPKSPTVQPVKIPIGSGKSDKQLVGASNQQK